MGEGYLGPNQWGGLKVVVRPFREIREIIPDGRKHYLWFAACNGEIVSSMMTPEGLRNMLQCSYGEGTEIKVYHR